MSKVKVFYLSRFDRRKGPTHGRAIDLPTISATGSEAERLVQAKMAVWRGRGRRQIQLKIPVNCYLGFVGQVRNKVECRPTSIDSKTHANLGGARYKHIRNHVYAGGVSRIATVIELLNDAFLEQDSVPLEAVSDGSLNANLDER